jgi:UDPglucose 6-dehydrogenase
VINIGVLGSGYVGLVTGSCLADFGNSVICADIDQEKIQVLIEGRLPIFEPGLQEIVERNVAAERLRFTTDLSVCVQESEVVFIAVGTPQSMTGEADLSAIEAAAEVIGKNLNTYKVIVTKSTVPVGTSEIIERVIRTNNTQGQPFDLVSNPEFLRQGAAVKDFLLPDRIVIGAHSEKAIQTMQTVYRPLYIRETPMVISNIPTAEMIKYASNSFLAVKISFINEVANLCDETGADIHQVAKAMGLDGRISPKFLHPGPGFGGSCFPKDTKALVEIGKKHRIKLHVVEAAIRANEYQPLRMMEKLKKLVPDLPGKIITVLGLSFKPNTDDIREAPSIKVIRYLLEAGAKIKAYDPAAMRQMERVFPDVEYHGTVLSAVKDADAVVILTDWNEFRSLNLVEMKKRMKGDRILDTRNILDTKALAELGFVYLTVGRPKA